MTEDTSEKPQSASRGGERSAWEIFCGWHTQDDKLWREIYARNISTLLAAFIAYLIAVIAGVASLAPLKIIGLILAVVAALAVVGILVGFVMSARVSRFRPTYSFGLLFMLGSITTGLVASVVGWYDWYKSSNNLVAYFNDGWFLIAAGVGVASGVAVLVRENLAFRRSGMTRHGSHAN